MPINGVTFHTPVLNFEAKGCFVRIKGVTFRTPALHSFANKCFNFEPINGVTFRTPALHSSENKCFNFEPINGVTFHSPALHSSAHFVPVSGVSFHTPSLHFLANKRFVPINRITYHTPVVQHFGSKKGVVLYGLMESLNGAIAKIPATLLCENVSCYAYELIQSSPFGTLTSKLNSKVNNFGGFVGRLTIPLPPPHPPMDS